MTMGHGISSKTRTVSIRLTNEEYAEVERLIKDSPANPHNSVAAHCQAAIKRYIHRHDKK